MPAQLFCHLTHMNNTMKNTIITLASVAALTGAANAQTWFDFSGAVTSQIQSASGQDFSLMGATVNVKHTGGGIPIEGIDSGFDGFGVYVPVGDPQTDLRHGYSGNRGGSPGDATYTLTFSNLPADLAKITLLDNQVTAPGETMTYVTDGTAWVTESDGTSGPGAGTVAYVTSGEGTTSLSLTGGPRPGLSMGYAMSTTGASVITWSLSEANTQGGAGVLKVGFTTVPEPSSTALLGLGALGLLVRRKR